MFTQHQTDTMATLINNQRDSLDLRDRDWKAKWQTVFQTAVNMGVLFTADYERFDAERFFRACGYGDQPVQRAVNLCGQLTKADIGAMKTAVKR